MGTVRSEAKGIKSLPKIIANIFISFIGAGILGLPYAFKEAGLVEGALLMATVGFLSVYAMLLLIDCKYAILSHGKHFTSTSIFLQNKDISLLPNGYEDSSDSEDPPSTIQVSSDLTYGDVAFQAMGVSGRRLVDVSVVVSQVGFCCGYLIYLSKTLAVYVPQLSQSGWLFILLPPLYCLTLLRHLDKLAAFSILSQVFTVMALTVVFWFDFSHSESVPFVAKEYSFSGLPFFFSVAIYCYEGAGLILPLEASVAESVRSKFKRIFVLTLAVLSILYICFGVSGYLSFGPHTEDIITLNLPHTDNVFDFAVIVKVCLGVSLFFTYPMMMFPVSHLLDKSCHLNATIYGNLVRLLLVTASGLVVIVIPNFGVLIGLIGATCCTLLSFILPPIFHLRIFRSRLTRKQRYFRWLLVMVGICGAAVGIKDTFSRLGGDALFELYPFTVLKSKTST